jgi:parallel beta-helix repeat protein
MRFKLSIVTALFLFIAVLSFGADYYVNAVSGLDSNTGTSPGNAWQTITNALSQVEGTLEAPVTINIAPGTYDWNIGEYFPLVMENFVNLKGANKDTTIIDAKESELTAISFTDITDSIIEGVTITNGGHVLGNGGGIYCLNSNPSIRNCIITNNISKNGSGLYLENSSPTISNCSIIKNVQGNTGGGIFCTQSAPTIINSVIAENVINGYGAGIYSYNSGPTITSTEIRNNQTTSYAGGIFMQGATSQGASPQLNNCIVKGNTSGGCAAIWCYASAAKIIDCTISENTSNGDGGGLYLQYEPAPTVTNCIIQNNHSNNGAGIYMYSMSSLLLSNCEIEHNIAASSGGGIFFNSLTITVNNILLATNEAQWGAGYYCYYASPTLGNFTLADNIASAEGSAIYSYATSVINMINSIIWDAGEHALIYKTDDSQVKITYSDVEGSFYGVGNKKVDPLFASGPRGDYYLSQTAAGQASTSICVDTGSDTATNLLLDTLTTRTDNVTDSGKVDMGFHYSTKEPEEQMIQFGLSVDPVKQTYSAGDTLNFLLDLKTPTLTKTVDVFILVMNVDTGAAFFALKWASTPMPALKNLTLPSNLDMKGAILFQITLPSKTPPISNPGNYLMAIAATKPNTLDFLSNIASANFIVQ